MDIPEDTVRDAILLDGGRKRYLYDDDDDRPRRRRPPRRRRRRGPRASVSESFWEVMRVPIGLGFLGLGFLLVCGGILVASEKFEYAIPGLIIGPACWYWAYKAFRGQWDD